MSKYDLYWGKPFENDYNDILDQFSKTKINSIETSSIPLAQYWKKTNYALDELQKGTNDNLINPKLHFEYPVKSAGSNRASMTDLMIFSDNVIIAIEAKYTEYVQSSYELIKKWKKNGSNEENRQNVLSHWLDILKPFAEIKNEKIDEIPYQLLHRTASACFKNNDKAVVVYQLFYKSEDKDKLNKFIEEFKKWKSYFAPNKNLEFYIQTIETYKNETKVKKDEVFQVLKEFDIFNFKEIEWMKI